jgi:hypothetical protein
MDKRLLPFCLILIILMASVLLLNNRSVYQIDQSKFVNPNLIQSHVTVTDNEEKKLIDRILDNYLVCDSAKMEIFTSLDFRVHPAKQSLYDVSKKTGDSLYTITIFYDDVIITETRNDLTINKYYPEIAVDDFNKLVSLCDLSQREMKSYDKRVLTNRSSAVISTFPENYIKGFIDATFVDDKKKLTQIKTIIDDVRKWQPYRLVNSTITTKQNPSKNKIEVIFTQAVPSFTFETANALGVKLYLGINDHTSQHELFFYEKYVTIKTTELLKGNRYRESHFNASKEEMEQLYILLQSIKNQ